jgi:hypothetical protein
MSLRKMKSDISIANCIFATEVQFIGYLKSQTNISQHLKRSAAMPRYESTYFNFTILSL